MSKVAGVVVLLVIAGMVARQWDGDGFGVCCILFPWH